MYERGCCRGYERRYIKERVNGLISEGVHNNNLLVDVLGYMTGCVLESIGENITPVSRGGDSSG